MKSIIYIRQTAIYNDSRATKSINALLGGGYHVIVLGWDRNGDAVEKVQEIFNGKSVEFYFFSRLLKHGSGLKGIVKLLKFNLWIKSNLKNLHNKIDYVHCCDLDTAILAQKFAKKNKWKFVYDIYDYYVDAHWVPKFLKNVVEKKEIKVINNADIVIICTEARINQISKAMPRQIVVIHNSPNLVGIKFLENKTNMPIKIKIAYVGTLSEGRLLKEIGDKIKQHNNIELHIGGIGKYEGLFNLLSKEAGNVKYYGQMEYSQVLELEAECDILFATYSPNIANHKYSAPNKMYEAMALGKPIVVCKGTGIDLFVEKEGIGKAINYDVEDFFNAVEDYLRHPEYFIETSITAKNAYKKFDWSIMAKRLVNIYNSFEEEKL